MMSELVLHGGVLVLVLNVGVIVVLVILCIHIDHKQKKKIKELEEEVKRLRKIYNVDELSEGEYVRSHMQILMYHSSARTFYVLDRYYDPVARAMKTPPRCFQKKGETISEIRD